MKLPDETLPKMAVVSIQVDVKGKILRDGQTEDGPESDFLVEAEISVD